MTCAAPARWRRAIDLAFEHFAHFGRDDDIIDLLAEAIERTEAPSVLATDSPSCAPRTVDGSSSDHAADDPGTVDPCR